MIGSRPPASGGGREHRNQTESTHLLICRLLFAVAGFAGIKKDFAAGRQLRRFLYSALFFEYNRKKLPTLLLKKE